MTDPRNNDVIGRLAPSPTGRMHLGNVYAALAAWLAARSASGRILLRIEDIDTPRVVRDADRWIMDDLTWLGLDWDGEPVYQSQRFDLYEEALRRLRQMSLPGWATDTGGDGVEHPLVYPCFCSRADIRAASAPNEGDGFLIYPGTCRRLSDDERRTRLTRGDRHSWRIAVPDASTAESNRVMRFDDRVFGPQTFDLARQLGDVVIRRSDGLFAYQLAVSVDDLEMGVTQIVRGRDLLRSTAIQLWVRRWLCACGFGTLGEQASIRVHEGESVSWASPMEFAHLPLIDAADGIRMAKRLNSVDVEAMREHGIDSRAIIGYCAWLLGLIDVPQPASPAELLTLFSWNKVGFDTSDRIVDVDTMTR